MRGSDTKVDPVLRERVNKECRGKLCARSNGKSTKTRVFTVVSGFGPNHNLGVYNNSVAAVERAFVERYFLCKHATGFEPALRPQADKFETKWFKDFRKKCLKYMPHLPVLTYEETLCLFPAKKRMVYMQALESLSRVGKVGKRDARLSSFVKFEKQDVCKAPRIINPRSPRYNLEVARYLKHFEHHMFRAINVAFGERTAATVIKGLDADAAGAVLRAKWDLFANPIAIGLDATKFDMHVSPVALKYEHTFYNKYWKSAELKEMLSWQLDNKGTARCQDGKVNFSMKGTRCSGDINTSLGNCVIMCALVYAYCKQVGVRVELANNGDDCVVFMERSDERAFRAGLEEFFESRGFVMEVEPTCMEFEELEFCQTHPCKIGGAWRMIRNPSTCLKKDVMCLRPMQNDECFKKWLYAVGDAGCSLNAGVPVLEAFYKGLKKNGVESKRFSDLVSPYRFASTSVRTCEVTDEARASFYVAFGLTPPLQMAMERLLENRTIDSVDWNEIERNDLVVELPGTQILTW